MNAPNFLESKVIKHYKDQKIGYAVKNMILYFYILVILFFLRVTSVNKEPFMTFISEIMDVLYGEWSIINA